MSLERGHPANMVGWRESYSDSSQSGRFILQKDPPPGKAKGDPQLQALIEKAERETRSCSPRGSDK